MNINKWQCPYCGAFQVLQQGRNTQDMRVRNNQMTSMTKYGLIEANVISIGCLNCEELTLSFSLHKVKSYSNTAYKFVTEKLNSWTLIPESKAKPQPDYIPKKIVSYYNQACKIVEPSPPASAMLARKCLEGIISDFCGIKVSKRLSEMIQELKQKSSEIKGVTEESIVAIDHIRNKGNIAAHFKQPTDLLMNDISKEEASMLIELLEMLFKDWYIDRHNRKERLKKLKSEKTEYPKANKTTGLQNDHTAQV